MKNGLIQHRIDFIHSHIGKVRRIYKLGTGDFDASRTGAGFAPFRQGFVSTVFTDGVNADTKLFYELRSSVGDLQRVTETAETAFRENDYNIT